jgi:hypothetical protein
MADTLTVLAEADPRVRRWRRLDFAGDGGVVLVVELHDRQDAISKRIVAQELEGVVTAALPAPTWIRVQVE